MGGHSYQHLSRYHEWAANNSPPRHEYLSHRLTFNAIAPRYNAIVEPLILKMGTDGKPRRLTHLEFFWKYREEAWNMKWKILNRLLFNKMPQNTN